MHHSIDNYALILCPKKKLIDWSNYIFPGLPSTESPTMTSPDASQVYLIPQFNNTPEAQEWLELNFDYFFQCELEMWCIDETLWPQDRTWKMFQDWLYISIQSCVYRVDDGEDF